LSDQLLGLMAMRRSYERYFSEAELQKMLDAQDALGAAGLARIQGRNGRSWCRRCGRRWSVVPGRAPQPSRRWRDAGSR